MITKQSCGHNHFDELNAKSKDESLKLISETSKLNSSIIVCNSLYCQSHLLLCQREGSWLTENIKITDVYSLLLSSLTGDDI